MGTHYYYIDYKYMCMNSTDSPLDTTLSLLIEHYVNCSWFLAGHHL